MPVPLANDLLPEIYDSLILIVDDDALSRVFIEKALRERGFKNILIATDGVKALAQLERSQPDLVILDIHMAGLNGLDCCEWIRAQPRLQDLPVLMLTALADEKLRFQSFTAGATDFVNKPLHPEELAGRVKVHLQNRLSLKRLQRYRYRIERELEAARELQMNILPTEAECRDAESCKLSVASHFATSSEIGGDFWGTKRLFPGQASFWMVDFSGHGVASALNAFRLQAHLKETSPLATKPGEYLSHLNEKLLNLLPRGYFATMFYGIADTRGNRLHYSCACAPHPYLLRKSGEVEKIDGTGIPLGICMQYYPTHSVAFHPGDTLLLYSDALIETPDAEGRFIDDKILESIFNEHRNAEPAQLRDAILERFSAHCSAPARDDLTLCIVKRQDAS